VLFDASGNLLPAFYENGSIQVPFTVDDISIQIPMGGQDFYFFGTNYGATNTIYWNTNNAITFGYMADQHLVSISANTIPAILLGNYDRLLSSIFYANYDSQNNLFRITKLVIAFSNYFTDTSNLSAGKLQIRFIRENGGQQRQWVEVGIISSLSSPGYSNDPTISYPSGTYQATDASGNSISDPDNGKPIDSDGYIIDSTKNSPWDVTNGSNFLNVAGTQYASSYPIAGTTLLYQSDSTGYNWSLTNAYMNI
jgi:hypothetical protein